MLSPYVKALMKETGQSEQEMSVLWNKAKLITNDTFGKSDEQFGKKEYRYTTDVVKSMLGVNENCVKPIDFLKFNGSVDEFMEVVTSGAFPSLDKHIVSKDTKKKTKVIQLDKEMDKNKEKKSLNAVEEAENLIFDHEQYGDDDPKQKYEYEQYEQTDRFNIGQDQFRKYHEERIKEQEENDDKEQLAREKELDKEQADYDRQKEKEKADAEKADEEEKKDRGKEKDKESDELTKEKEKERSDQAKEKEKERLARKKEKEAEMEKQKQASKEKSATSVNK